MILTILPPSLPAETRRAPGSAVRQGNARSFDDFNHKGWHITDTAFDPRACVP